LCHQAFRRILDIYDALNGELHSSPGDVTGNVYVAAIYSVGLHGLGNSMQEFMKSCPRATVRLEYLRPAEVYEAVKNGMVDLGVVSYPVAQPGLNVVLLRSERMVLACHPDHPLARHQAVSLHMLQGENLIGFDRGLPIRKDIDRCLRRHSVSVQVTMEFDNIETIKHAVEIGGGISLVPEPTVCKEARSGSLAVVRLLDCELRRPIGLIYLDRKMFTPAMSKFVELLEKVEVETLADAS
jgi:DNA-binding transcriptional LysR family regulator